MNITPVRRIMRMARKCRHDIKINEEDAGKL